jgi:hypothetical protein
MHSRVWSTLALLVPLVAAVPTSETAQEVLAAPHAAGTKIGQQGVPQDLWNDLVYYTRISAASYYRHNCPKPNGVPKRYTYVKNDQDTDGFIAIDEPRKDIIIVIRGSSSLKNFATDGSQWLSAWSGQGISCKGCKLHDGYMKGWQAIEKEVIQQLNKFTKQYPSFRITVTGHSLGASEAAIGAGQLAGIFPNKVWLYTQGEPRTGNKAYADYMDKMIGPTRIFRGTHKDDGIPQVDGTNRGYAHHSTEYWGTDPPGRANVKNCGKDNENECNGKAGKGHSLNAAHLKYFGVGIGVAELNTNVKCS